MHACARACVWIYNMCVCVCVSVLLHLLSTTCNIQCYLSVHMNEMLPVSLQDVDTNAGWTPVELHNSPISVLSVSPLSSLHTVLSVSPHHLPLLLLLPALLTLSPVFSLLCSSNTSQRCPLPSYSYMSSISPVHYSAFPSVSLIHSVAQSLCHSVNIIEVNKPPLQQRHACAAATM